MRVTPFILSLVTVFFITGCDETPKNAESQAEPEPNVQPIDTAQPNNSDNYVSSLPDDAPIYTAGVTFNSPYYLNDQFGKPTGYDIDLIRAIGEEEGFKVHFKQLPFKQVFPSVDNGTVDLALSGFSLTPEREASYAVSAPYSRGKAGYMLTAESPYNTKEELDDKTVGVISGANLTNMIKTNSNAVVIEKPTLFLAFKTIFTKESDAVFGFEPNLTHESQQFTDYSFKFVPFSEDVPTVMYANKNNQEMINKVNAGLDKIQANGKYQKISEKWFGNKASTFTVE